MKRPLLLIGAATAMVAAPLAYGEVVYQNDFSTRTSKGNVPYGDWRGVNYVTGKLVNNAYATAADVFGAADIQDGWIKGRNNCDGFAHIVDDGGNMEALMCYDTKPTESRHVIAKQRLGNTFTTGIVTAQCDLRPPTDWISYSLRSVRFALADDTFYSPDTGANDYMSYIAAGAGVSYDNGRKFYKYGTVTAAEAKSGVWYRVVLTANLDTKKYNIAIYEMGSAHPAFDAATPETAAYSESDIDFWSVTKRVAMNGISSIAIMCYGAGGSTEANMRDYTALFDNIRVAHNGIECYENDFVTRRSRKLATGTATASYSATTPATNIYTYATTVTNLLAAQNASLMVQPVGVDGWRRLNKDQTGMLKKIVFQGDNVGQTTDDTETQFDWAGHPIGQTFTSGKVRIAADMRTTSLSDYGSAYLALGNDVMYAGNHGTYISGSAIRAGISGENVETVDGVKRKVAYWSNGSVTKPGDGVVLSQWMRFVIEADLDAKTYDFTIYRQSDKDSHPAYGSADGSVLYSKTGIAFANPNYSISSFALVSYWSVTYYDNVRIWHTPTGGAASLVYYDTFTKRMACDYGGVEDKLVGTLNKADYVGIDSWTRLSRSNDDIMLVGGGNQAIGFGAVATDASVFATHDIGGVYKNGKMTAQFDMCAPSSWASGSSGAYVWLGGDQFHEGNLNGGIYSFSKWVACGAGLSGAAFAAYEGDGEGGGAFQTSGTATPGHWYRFVVVSDLNAATSDVNVFDMGTTQPTLATDTPTTGAVATFAAVPFRQAAANLGGVSCVGIQAKGVNVASPFKTDDYQLLIDNFCVCAQQRGMIIIVK